MDENKRDSEGRSVPRKRRHFFLSVLGIALLLMLLGNILGILLLGLIRYAFPGISDSVVFLFMYLEFIGIDILVLLYCGLWEKDILRSFLQAKRGGAQGNTGKNFAIGLLIGFAMNGVCILLAWLHGDIHLSAGPFHVVYMICALLVVCVQSGAEEILTRGYMMGALRERYGVWVAIIVNSLSFAVLHLLNPGITVLSFANILLIGLALSLVIYCLDSLWMCIAIHTAWNYTQNFLFGLPNSGSVSKASFLHLEAARDSLFFYDATFGIEGAVTAAAVTVLLAVFVWLWPRRRKASSPYSD